MFYGQPFTAACRKTIWRRGTARASGRKMGFVKDNIAYDFNKIVSYFKIEYIMQKLHINFLMMCSFCIYKLSKIVLSA